LSLEVFFHQEPHRGDLDHALVDGDGRILHPIATLISADLVDRKFIAGARELGVLDVLWRPIELDRLRSSIWTAHHASLERLPWLAEREHEWRSNRHPISGFRLETVK
jgi:AmiR/NasT family two-component response regulator